MNPTTLLSTLSTELSDSAHFETAGERLLSAVFEVTSSAIGGSGDTRLVRGVIHHRPEDGYRRLLCRDLGPSPDNSVARELPSVTAWHWLARRRCPVSIDVESRLLHVFEGGSPRVIHDPSGGGGLAASETCQRLHAREVTYLHALPMRSPRNRVDGMVAIEMSGPSNPCEQVVARAGLVLQLLVDLATPHLATLPSAHAAPLPANDPFLPVIGKETASIVELLRVFSALPETILLMGPTGSGKSRLARYVHAQSPRSEKPFVTLDLLACPEHLQMASLTGWKRGAFTGADRDSPGAVQRAEGGTLFLDEIDKLSLQAQAGLLRLVEDRVYRPAGDTGDDRRADIRIIVGTNANLRALVEAGRFREDLYWRIAVLMVRVLPLSKRVDEVAGWADFMLSRCASASGGPSSEPARLDADAIKILETQRWPGNLRQLDNVVRRAYAYALAQHVSNGRLVVSAAHAERAVREESFVDSPTQKSASVPRQFRAAARAFAREVERRAQSNEPLSLDWTDAFRGFVLEEAIKRFGHDKAKALEALGLGSIVKDRNHHRMLRREFELMSRFLALFE